MHKILVAIILFDTLFKKVFTKAVDLSNTYYHTLVLDPTLLMALVLLPSHRHHNLCTGIANGKEL
jgi:hypothetical protein